jgi:RNA polymerase sigma-70 factor, ECF subfamily
MRPDAELVDSTLKGDRAAYGKLVCRYGQCVVAAIWQILGDYHAAQDAAQEVFLTAYQKLGSLRNGSMFGPWVLTSARRYAYRTARHQTRFVGFDVANGPVAETEYDRLAEDQQDLLMAVNRLPEHERVVVVLHYFQENSVQAVADLMGRPLGTVKKQLSRALRRLRTHLSSTASHKELQR